MVEHELGEEQQEELDVLLHGRRDLAELCVCGQKRKVNSTPFYEQDLAPMGPMLKRSQS